MIRRALVVAVIVVAGCRAAPIPTNERYPAGTPFRATYRAVDGARLRIIDSGPAGATPVVFIHGLGASMYSWHRVLPVVAGGGHRVIAFDLPGFGFSDPDDTESEFTNARYSRLVVALLDSLGLASAVLVGHSMGGAIAAEVALDHPERVRALVLMNSAGSSMRMPIMLRAARWSFVGVVVTAFRGRWPTARILRSSFADPARVTEADIDQYYAPVPEARFGRALRGVLRGFRFDTLIGRLATTTLTTPTLVLWGAEDRLIPVREGSRLASAMPRATFVVVPDAGHAVAEEAPAEVNRLLLEFLKEGLSRIPENVAWSTPSLRSSRSSSSRSIPPIPRKSAS
jgi:pimeloyl-ACP methyl ester carboxylesterase